MASQQQHAPTQAHAQSKTEQWADSARSTAHSAVNKAENAAQNAQHSAQQQRQHHGEAGFLQQTGEQVAHMAQGAIDGVKNTLGIGDNAPNASHLSNAPNAPNASHLSNAPNASHRSNAPNASHPANAAATFDSNAATRGSHARNAASKRTS